MPSSQQRTALNFAPSSERVFIPTPHGEFQMVVCTEIETSKEHAILIHRKPESQETVPLVRIHSECLTGDVFGSKRCDCGEQLEEAMQLISSCDYGVLLYLRQEGRGIGLAEKIKAYALQDQGLDTIDANLQLGHAADTRDYTLAISILQHLQIEEVDLLTNNPEKKAALEDSGIKVRRRLSGKSFINEINKHYLRTKKTRMGHAIPGLERQVSNQKSDGKY